MTTKRETSFKDRERRQVALASKYVRDHRHDSGYDNQGNKQDPVPPSALLNNISQRTAGVVNDIESITQLLPDTELMIQILVSSILSPKDLGEPKLQFESDSDIGDDGLNNKFLSIIEDYFTEDYKINDKLADILTEALITKGAYIEAIIPESGLDKLINPAGTTTLEDAKGAINDDLSLNPIGLVKDTEKVNLDESNVSLESFYDGVDLGNTGGYNLFRGITLNDNPDTLKVPTVLKKITKDRQADVLNRKYSLESSSARVGKSKTKLKKLKGKSHREIVETIDTNRGQFKANGGFVELTEGDLSKTVGHPTTLKIPVEAMVVVFSPGKPEEPLGGFVILDQFGNPIDLTTTVDHYRNIQSNINRTSGESAVSDILSELRGGGGMNMGGGEGMNQQVEEVVRTFSQLIERKLLNSISSGFEDKGLNLSYSNDIYTTMLSRSLSNQSTQVLYVPSEMFSYIAFNYGKNGIGKSILEDSRILGSLRVMMMFNDTMASIKNSTNRTELNINFDPTDTDPLSSATMVKDAFMRAKAEGYPLGEGDPSALIKYIQAANVDVVYGNHPDLPEMSVESNDVTTSKTNVDRDLTDDLRDWYIMSLGLSPETVDNGKNADFATSIVVSNLLLSKRVIIYQAKYESQLADKIKTYTHYSSILMDKLTEAVSEHGNAGSQRKSQEVVNEFVRKLKVKLPRPDSASLESKMESFDAYERALDLALEYYIDSQFISRDTAGEMGDNIDDVKYAIKAYYMRRYMKEYNILPELEEMVGVDDKGKSTFKFDDIQNGHVKAIMGAIEKYLRRSLRDAKRRDKRLSDLEEKIDAEPDEEEQKTPEAEPEPEADDTPEDEAEGEDDAPTDDTDDDDAGDEGDEGGDDPQGGGFQL